MKSRKRFLILLSLLLGIGALIYPFLISSGKESCTDLLVLSFTSLGAVGTIITLFIVLSLYQRYGMESRFIERQVDKTLELVDYLKGKTVYISGEKSVPFFMSRFDYYDFSSFVAFKSIKHKMVTINKKDYDAFIAPIIEIMRSYWLPEIIKQKLAFLIFPCLSDVPIDDQKNKCAKLNFLEGIEGEFLLGIPEITVDEYITKKIELIGTIEKWLKKHCDIKLELKFEEPNQEVNY